MRRNARAGERSGARSRPPSSASSACRWTRSPRPSTPAARPGRCSRSGKRSDGSRQDGRSLVMAESHGAWVEAHVMDLVDGTVRARVAFRAPEPVGHAIVEVTGDTVWLLGTRGVAARALALDLGGDGPSPLPWRCSRPAPGYTTTRSPWGRDAAPPRFLWSRAAPRRETSSGNMRVVDLSQRRPAREVLEPQRFSVLRGAREPRVACCRSEVMVLHEERGTALPGKSIEVPFAVPVGAVLHPDEAQPRTARPPPARRARRRGATPGSSCQREARPARSTTSRTPTRRSRRASARAADAGVVAISTTSTCSATASLIALGASAGRPRSALPRAHVPPRRPRAGRRRPGRSASSTPR